MKRILAIFISIILLIGILPLGTFTASAATSGTTGSCRWSLNGTVLTISGNGAMGNYNSYSSLSPWGRSITSVTIKNGVTTIGDCAFYCCESLTSITIPDSVTSIGKNAFDGCSSLISVTIGDSVTSIGMCAFRNCSYLISVTISDSVTTISDYAFNCCNRLKTIYYCGTKEQWNVIHIGSYNSSLTNATRYYHLYDYVCDAECNICGNIRTTEHTYDNTCDKICNVCSFTRNIAHTYDNACDTSCNICGYVRSIEHTYDNACDTRCNICGFTRTIEHTYDNACDTECNICGFVRGIEHTYDYHCDSECNVCNEIRDVKHKYLDDGKCEWCNSYVESKHDYDIEFDETWIITKENTASITVTFSPETYVEKDWDYIYIYDANGLVGEYTGSELASKSITVWGDTVKIRLFSDRMNTAYGFKVTNIEFACAHNYSVETKAVSCFEDGYTKYTCEHCGDFYFENIITAVGAHIYENGYCKYCGNLLESAHDYENLFDETWTIFCKGATSITITFSAETYVEQKYDKIYIYDSNPEPIGEYTGGELASRSITVSGDTIKIRLVSDRINTAYGFKLTDISAEYVEGDLNADGETDIRDLIRLKKILAGKAESEGASADVDNSGRTDALDLAILRKLILNSLMLQNLA